MTKEEFNAISQSEEAKRIIKQLVRETYPELQETLKEEV